MLNGHKTKCPKCCSSLFELKTPYMDFVTLNRDGREAFRKSLDNVATLNDNSRIYRMHRYSKWYKELHKGDSVTNQTDFPDSDGNTQASDI